MRESNLHLEGAGFTDFIKNPISRIKSMMKGVRQNFPPKVRQKLEEYSDYEINFMDVYRIPINQKIDTAFNIASFGGWDKAKKEEGFDSMFHLGLLIGLKGVQGLFRLEKNQVIEMYSAPSYDKRMTKARVDVINKNITLNDLLVKTYKATGNMFFQYHPFTNNCQNFVTMILRHNNLLTPELNTFINQSVTNLVPKLNKFTQAIAPIVTKIGAIADVGLEGEGFVKNIAN